MVTFLTPLAPNERQGNKQKGSIGRAFTVRTFTEGRDRADFCPFALREVSVLAELTLGHLRYLLTDVPPQSNSPPDTVFRADRGRLEARPLNSRSEGLAPRFPLH